MSKSILIVDDEKDVADALTMGLKRNGFEVTTFYDPMEALAGYKPGQYSLAILDIRMPGMDGFELFRRLKKVDPGAKICFLTAFEMYGSEFERLFPNVQVAGFLRKPIAISELVLQVKRMTK